MLECAWALGDWFLFSARDMSGRRHSHVHYMMRAITQFTVPIYCAARILLDREDGCTQMAPECPFIHRGCTTMKSFECDTAGAKKMTCPASFRCIPFAVQLVKNVWRNMRSCVT